MLFLDTYSLLIKTILTERTAPGATPSSLSQVVSDFDGVSFHLSTPESKSKILVSMSIKCFKDLQKYNVNDILEREYKGYIVDAEPGYDFSIEIDLDNLPPTDGLSKTEKILNNT